MGIVTMAPLAYISLPLRQFVAERAQFHCEYCQLQQELCPKTFEVDHIIPRAIGGQTALGNLCYACPMCNNAKRSHITGQEPQTGRRVRLFNPQAATLVPNILHTQDRIRDIITACNFGHIRIERVGMHHHSHSAGGHVS